MTLRWGILSTARIGREKVIPGIQRAASCEVVAIGGRDRQRTEAVARDLGIDRVHDSYQAVLADPDVDAVYIPLPNHLHAEWTVRAAEAGKHVLCEKPLGLDAAEAQRMVDACADAGITFMEAFMYRLHPTWRHVTELVEDGTIGRLVTIQSWFSYFNDDPSNIRNIADYGGGAVMDIGCYPINLSRMLFAAEPAEVTATVTRDPVTDVDIVTSALLEFENGTATFTCSTRCEPDQRVHIYGTEGRISVDIPFNIPPDLPTRIRVTAGGQPPTAPDTDVITFEPADQYQIEAERFAEAALTGSPAPIPPSDGVANMAVIDRILRG